jgi:hypothetical protein
MCEPVTIGSLTITATQMAWIGTAVTVASTAASVYGQHQSAVAQVKAINKQNQIQAQEIASAAGQDMTERARAARRERGAMRASGAQAGIAVDNGGSFVAALQTSALNQNIDNGLISYNERAQQRARNANYRSSLSQISMPTGLSAALAIGSSYIGARNEFQVAGTNGSKSATGGP